MYANRVGVLYRDDPNAPTDPATITEQFVTNAMGPLLVSQHLLPSLRQSQAPKVITLTSRMGSIADNTSGGYYGYRASKAAVNAMMKSFAMDNPQV